MHLRNPCGHVPISWRSSPPVASAQPNGTAGVRPSPGCRFISRRIPADRYDSGSSGTRTIRSVYLCRIPRDGAAKYNSGSPAGLSSLITCVGVLSACTTGRSRRCCFMRSHTGTKYLANEMIQFAMVCLEISRPLHLNFCSILLNGRARTY